MAIITSQPEERDGKVYDRLAVNLAMSPMWQGDRLGLSIAVRLTPYRKDDQGQIERLDDAARAVVYGDAMEVAQTDPDVAQFLGALETAAKAFIAAKGL